MDTGNTSNKKQDAPSFQGNITTGDITATAPVSISSNVNKIDQGKRPSGIDLKGHLGTHSIEERKHGAGSMARDDEIKSRAVNIHFVSSLICDIRLKQVEMATLSDKTALA